ncbi:UNVERIFIED_CONTAM: Retrovirus-related Pol polyprotein from transposon RE1 [Sesamum indicum]
MAGEQYEKDVLYLHPSDSSSFVLASTPLTGSNYLTWSRAVYVALGCKMKLAFIDGTFPRPPAGSVQFEQWRRADLMVTSWLWNSISKEIVEAFMYVSSSRELWLELQARYGRSSAPLIYQLQREISSISQGDMTLTTYLTKMKKLWNELFCLAPSPKCTCGGCTCGINTAIGTMYSRMQLMQFLMGLHESFEKEKSQLLMMDPLPDLEKAFSMVFAVEQQRNVQVQLADNTAYQVNLKEHKKEGTQNQLQKRKSFVDKRTMVCTHCNKIGHLRNTCFQLHGTPDWFKALNDKKRQTVVSHNFSGNVGGQTVSKVDGSGASTEARSEVVDLMEELLKMMKQKEVPSDPISNYANYVHYDEQFAGNVLVPPTPSLNEWIIDTGATNHVCAHLSCFDTYTIPSHTHLKTVTHVGTVRISEKLILTSVFFIPDFSVNLLSVSQLCNSNAYSFLFNQFTCILQDQVSKEVVAKGTLNRKLYILRSSNFKPSFNSSVSGSNSCSSVVECNDSLWHKRLGHAPMTAIKHIPECNISDDSLEMKCDICPKAKQSRIMFKPSDSQSITPFALIHLDVWGPYKTPSLSGCNYVLTILDDYSRCLWTYLIKHKDQVTSTLLQFSAMVKTQFEAKIKVLRTDNGSEFINANCQTLCHKLGIIHQTSCVYTPQQNGRVERKHRHLLNVARALLFQASLPLKFWGDCILAATYIINRTPTKLLHWNTPFQMLFGYAPNYSHIKIFGCLCFATNLSPHKTKFDKRAHKCVFLGYSMSQKGYKVFDLEDHTLFTSRDVIFQEHLFPYAQNKVEETSSCPLPTVTAGSIPIDLSHHSPNTATSPLPTIAENVPTNPSSDTISTPVIPPRRSARVSQKPPWLNDFVCQTNSAVLHSKSVAYTSFVASLSALQEPRSYEEASQYPEWRAAMNEEIQALEKNQTWKLTPLPPGKRAIGNKWVYKVKLRADGSIERYKARLVAKGYNQVEGVDYIESFSPVAKAVTVRLFLTLAAAKGWALQQLDVNNAFLHGHLDEDIYMFPPAGCKVGPGLVCKLERSLYGLKQASRQWNVELTMRLQEFGFVQCAHDHCLFILHTGRGLISLLVYVDDILLAGDCIDELQRVKSYLHDLFTIKDIGDARYFLGLEIARNSDGIYLAQTKYIQDIIADTGLQQAKAVSTPFPTGLKLCSDAGALLQAPDSYRRLVGRLLYLSFTRPDISHSVQQLSQFLNHPCDVHWNAALHVVRYLKGCPSLGLFLPAVNSLELQGYCDADWASCSDSRRSLTGFCIFLGPALVSWKTKKQSTVSRSSAEAEYRSLAATVCELRWLSFLLADFGVPLVLPVSLFCDNKAALHILANPVFHERTKHIEIDCHLVRDAYKDGFIAPVLVRSFTQLADTFTKALPLKIFSSILSKLGLVSFAPSPTCGGAVGISHSTAAVAAIDSATDMVDHTQKLEGAGVASDLLDQG